MNIMKPKADPTDTYASPEAIARTPEELLESMTGMFLPPSAMGEVNGLKILCLQRENTALKAEVERLKELVNESIIEKSNLSIALVNCQADLRRAIDVARMLPVIPIPAISSRDITDTLYAELNQLKATLNPTTEDSSAPPRTDAWECFSDPSYYDMARLRRTDGPKDFNTGYHLNNLREAVEVRDILNELERRAEKAEAKVERMRKIVEAL